MPGRQMGFLLLVIGIPTFAVACKGVVATNRSSEVFPLARVGHLHIGSTFTVRSLVLPSSGGYSYVLKEAACNSKVEYRIFSKIPTDLKRSIFRAQAMTSDKRRLYVQATITGRLVSGAKYNKPGDGIEIYSAKDLEMAPLDCLP